MYFNENTGTGSLVLHSSRCLHAYKVRVFKQKAKYFAVLFHCDKQQTKEALTVIDDEDTYINKLFKQLERLC